MDGRTLFRFGDWTVDPDREALIGPDGAEARLRRQSFAVLTHLARNAGRVVSKEELTAAIWPGVAVTDDSLVQCVHDIRAAIGPSGRQVVRTVPRRGYLLEAIPKEPPDAKPREAGAAADALAARPAPASRWRRAPWIVAGALVLALLAALTLGPGRSRQADGPPLVAVTPFQNLGDGTEAAHLAQGVRDTLAAELARSPFMKVLALEKPTGAAQAAREVGAHYLLTGSVQRDADAMRVVAQLVDARTGAHLWAERIDRTGADPFAVQDAVVTEIVRSVAGDRGLIKRAQYAEAWGKDSSSLGEYDYFLRGHALHMRFEPDANDQGQAIYEEGLSKYPNSSLLKIKLGYSHLARAGLGWTTDVEEELKRARALGERGLAEADGSPLSLQYGHMLMSDLAMME